MRPGDIVRDRTEGGLPVTVYVDPRGGRQSLGVSPVPRGLGAAVVFAVTRGDAGAGLTIAQARSLRDLLSDILDDCCETCRAPGAAEYLAATVDPDARRDGTEPVSLTRHMLCERCREAFEDDDLVVEFGPA